MAIKFSTGLADYISGTSASKGSLVEALTGLEIGLYSGSMPTTPDAAPTGTLLATILGPASAAIAFSAGALGSHSVVKEAAVWSGTISNAGNLNLGYARIRVKAEADGISTTDIRIDMDCGLGGSTAALVVPKLLYTTGETFTVDAATIVQPLS